MKFIDDILNSITMYRLVLYCLIFILAGAYLLSLLGVFPFGLLGLPVSVTILVFSCWFTNTFLAKIYKVPTNLESTYITALILALLLPPFSNIPDVMFLCTVAFLAMASKYLINIRGKHIFNPAAFAILVSSITFNYSATWWVGDRWMFPAVFLSGLLVIKKVRKFSLVLTFLITAISTLTIFQLINGSSILNIYRGFLDSPLYFFAFVMLIEPQTIPLNKKLQLIYGMLVGLLFTPLIRIGSIFSTPELALILGNIFSYFVNPKIKMLLKLKEKHQIGPDIYDFVFEGRPKFTPGQYMEWTLGHKNPDSRGSRRYFTIASSPTERLLRIGTKFYPNSSSWKKSLINMKPGDIIMVGNLSGEFTLPEDRNRKLTFLAGGIGITPYRSMIKYLLDKGEKRDIILLYSVKNTQEIVYKDLLDRASEVGVRSEYIKTDTQGFLDKAKITKYVPDYNERLFYISGPKVMVDAFGKALGEMDVSRLNIKTDFFPGYT